MSRSNAAHQPIAHKLHAFVCGMDRLSDRRLQQDLQLSFSHVLMLMAIGNSPGVSQREIASFRNVTEAAVSRQIDLLLKKRLISRHQNVKNRREHVLVLTPLGKARLAKAYTILEKSSTELFRVIGKKDQQTFARCLDAMLEVMCPNTTGLCGKK